jgi:hypothetical protein
VKIAILDVDPRICGPMSWTQHLATGFNDLGHEVAVVSATKSGRVRSSWGNQKWGGHWSAYTPSVVVKEADLVETLDTFDLIVLPEPKVPAVDKEAVKNSTVPVYVSALEETQTKFIFALHGNDYDEKSAPFLTNLVSAPNFAMSVISHSKRSENSLEIADLARHFIDVYDSPLPYAPKRDVRFKAEGAKQRVVGTTGRFMFNKGSHVVALAAQYTHSDTRVDLWGSAAAGLGASTTFVTYEALLDQAEWYQRFGDQEEKKDHPKATEHGNIIRPFPWEMKLKTGQFVRYLGNYTDPVLVCESLAVHVNLTGYKYSGDLVEYSTLEAMDAGSLCIAPSHVSNTRFSMNEIKLQNPPGTPKSALKDEELLRFIGSQIDFTMESALAGHNDEAVFYNRNVMRDYNDPKKVAKMFIEGAFS